MNKTQYRNVGLPISFLKRFRQFQPVLGYRTFSEFVVSNIRDCLSRDEDRADKILSEKVDQKLQEETF